jgi:hypothetical protein
MLEFHAVFKNCVKAVFNQNVRYGSLQQAHRVLRFDCFKRSLSVKKDSGG